MRTEDCINVIKKLSDVFDSHEFIKWFIWKYPTEYAVILIKHNNVTRAHASMARFLKSKAKKLNIIQDGTTTSKDIFGNEVENACWRKE